MEARRTELRHGGLSIVRATFAGFKSLPAPDRRDWRQIFGIESPNPKLADVEATYRALRSRHHPDKGGDPAKFDEVQKAWDQAQEALR